MATVVAWVLTALVALTVDAQETVVRVPATPACWSAGLTIADPCVCTPGALCLTRAEAETMAAIQDSEARCREDLGACRDQPPTVMEPGGWKGWEVGLLVAGVVVGALAIGFGVGYGLGASDL